MLSAAVYVRISADPTGASLGVRRQETDCRELCEQRGWAVAGVYEDNDFSAYTGRRRPAYERLCDDLKAGTVTAVVAWHPDRLHRSPRELETFIDLIDATGAQIATCRAGTYDLTTATGRMTARIVGATARYESELKSERTARKHLELAQRGVPVGGTRPFGYDPDGVTIRPDEAAIIRDAAARILAGESLWALCRDWNATGVAASRGGHWTQTAIRRILTNPRAAGHRTHHGTVTYRDAWPAILDEHTWQAVRAVIDTRATAGLRRARTYLLTGLLTCGLCGVRLVGQPHSRRSRTYTCPLNPGKGGCGRIRVVQAPLDDEIVGQVLARIDTPAFRAALAATGTPDTGATADVADLEGRLEQAARDHYTDRLISRAQFLAASQSLEAQAVAARRRLARERSTAIARDVTVDRGTFDGLGLDRQRALLAEVVERVTVAPAARPRGVFDPERVTVVWRV